MHDTWYRTLDPGTRSMRRRSAKEAHHYPCCDVARKQTARPSASHDKLTSPHPKHIRGSPSRIPESCAGSTRYSFDKMKSDFLPINRTHHGRARHSPHPARALKPKPRSGGRLSPHHCTRGKAAKQPTACGLLQASNPTPDIRRRELHLSQPVCRHLGPFVTALIPRNTTVHSLLRTTSSCLYLHRPRLHHKDTHYHCIRLAQYENAMSFSVLRHSRLLAQAPRTMTVRLLSTPPARAEVRTTTPTPTVPPPNFNQPPASASSGSSVQPSKNLDSKTSSSSSSSSRPRRTIKSKKAALTMVSVPLPNKCDRG